MTQSGDRPGPSGGANRSHRPAPRTAGRGAAKSTSSPTGDGTPAAKDVLFVHSPCESGAGYNVIRQRSDRLELGELRAVEQGRPLAGELVKLSPRSEHDRLFDVEVLVDTARHLPRARSSGPAKVSSTAYRDGWDSIFGGPATACSDGGDQPN